MCLLSKIDWGSIFCAFPVFIPRFLFIVLSIPMLFDKISPNAWYGFRTEKTLSNQEIWYKANRFMARDLLIFGILHTILMITFIISDSNPTVLGDLGGPWTLLIFPFPMALGLLVVIIRSFRYLKKL